MSAKPVIGVLGGIGSGKSTAAAALAARGGQLVAADPVGHEALRQPEIKARVKAHWPNAIGPEGDVDRKALGRVVFADADKLRELESLVYPWIKRRLLRQIESAKADAAVRFVVLDAALLLEAGWHGVCDRLVFVEAPRTVRIARVAQRGWSADDFDRRERSQMNLDDKRARANALLDNSGSPEQLQQQVDELLARWELISTPA